MRKPVGKRLLPPATVGALPLDSTEGIQSMLHYSGSRATILAQGR